MLQTRTANLHEKYAIEYQSDRAYETLREAILTGRFKPGTQLNERVICEMFELSRTPVRHAFARLTSDGLVEQVRHVGVFVRKLGPEEAIRLAEVRRAIEAGAAALAAEKADRAAADNLIELAKLADEAARTGTDEELLNCEIQFHRQVIACSGNSEMERLFDGLHALFLTLPINGKPGRGPARVGTHTEVAEAIARGDPVQAFRAMWSHTEMASASWQRMVKDSAAVSG